MTPRPGQRRVYALTGDFTEASINVPYLAPPAPMPALREIVGLYLDERKVGTVRKLLTELHGQHIHLSRDAETCTTECCVAARAALAAN